MPPDFRDRIINIKTSDAIQPDAKAPWKGITLEGQTESRFLFRTALAKSILPFALYKPDFVALPISIETNQQGEKEIKLYSANELMNEGYLCASKWFINTEHIWEVNRTTKSEKMTCNDRLNYQRGLTNQNFNAPYLVLFNSSAKDANATVVERKEIDLDFIVENVAYVFYTDNINEAYYLTAILNSDTPNKMMKDFQPKGLFGARHVHKKILDIYYPRFDGNDTVHVKLAELSKSAHEKASGFVKDNPPKQELSAIHLGRMRTSLKKHLVKELGEIDRIVKGVIGK